MIDNRQHAGNAFGAPRRSGFTGKPGSLKAPSRGERLAILRRAEALAERLDAAPDCSAHARAAALGKRRHLGVRADLQTSRVWRLPAICRELANAGSFKYSPGMRAALHDLLQAME